MTTYSDRDTAQGEKMRIGHTTREFATLAPPQHDDSRPPPDVNRFEVWLYRFPWWLAFLVVVGVWVGFQIAGDELYRGIFIQLRAGVEMTLRVSFIAFSGALLVGVLVGVIRSNPPKPQKGITKRALSLLQLFIYNLATLFLEIARGLPILTVLLIFGFVIMPEIKAYLRETYDIVLDFPSASLETAIIALAVVYGAFLSEVFRAGIQSVPRGQIEAAKSLGMTNLQVLRLVVLPQAIRRVLPPLGNDFLAMIKDSSLISYYGIREITQIAKISSGSSFRYLETYLVAAIIYLSLTVLGSLLLRLLEQRLGYER